MWPINCLSVTHESWLLRQSPQALGFSREQSAEAKFTDHHKQDF